jgi:hypothetical protein
VLKKKSSSLQKTASPEQIYLVGKSGILIYPISKASNWYIQVNNNGVITTFEKKISSAEINEALAKTIIYYYNKLKLII